MTSPDDWRIELRRRFATLAVDPASFESAIEEFAQHLESAEIDLRSRGRSVAEARSELLSEINDVTLRDVIERRARPHPPSSLAVGTSTSGQPVREDKSARIADVLRDLQFGLRTLLRERSFSAFIVTALALGIGANAAMFGVVDRLLLRGPLHVHESHQLRRVVSVTRPPDQPAQRTAYLTYAQYKAFRADTTVFTGVAAYNVLHGTMYGTRGNARPVHRGSATGNFFQLLGVRPTLGRFFTEQEDSPADPQRVVVLGYGFWQAEFGGDRNVLGRTIPLDYAMYTVIGVAPRGFTGVELSRVDAWVPESGVPHSTNWETIWHWPWLYVVVRMREDVSVAQVNDALTRLHRNGYQGRSDVDRNAVLTAEPIHFTNAGVEGTQTRLSRWLFGLSTAVLLIACANVVNLLLARTMRRRRELAVRLALGAGRPRIIRLLVLEAMILALAGGAAAIAVAYALGSTARGLIPEIDWSTGFVDIRLLAATAVFAVLVAGLVAVVPAMHGSAANPGDALKAGTREGGGRTSLLRSALMVTQAALSVMLLAGAGLFVQSVRQALSLDLGIATERLITFKLDHMPPKFSRSDTAAMRREIRRRNAFYPDVAERLRAWPEVAGVSLAGALPFVRVQEYPIRVPGRDSIPALPGGGPFVSAVSHDYFRTVRTPILRGRSFVADDRAGSVPVAIINASAARALWPSEDALGKCVVVADADACATVVGIAADTKRKSLHDEPALQVYVPLEQQPIGDDPRFVVRARSDVVALTARVREELLRLDPTILYIYVDQPHDDVLAQARPWRLGAVIFTLFGALALVVASVGLYSVVSYSVAQRTREIGVRMALGAHPRSVMWMALSNALALVGSGVMIGLLLTMTIGQGIRPLLFGTTPTNPLVMASVVGTMALVTVAAAFVPALRARRINPVEALRID